MAASGKGSGFTLGGMRAASRRGRAESPQRKAGVERTRARPTFGGRAGRPTTGVHRGPVPGPPIDQEAPTIAIVAERPRPLRPVRRARGGSARRRTGAPVSWPWTINAEGQGRFVPTKEAAIAAVRALQARGVTVIDVGCLQVNLHHHPRAFASLDEAFDPAANARYAGLFLSRLRQSARDWETAAGHYHSQTPELAEAYRLKVLAAWPGMAHRLAAERQREAAERQREAMIDSWGGGRRTPSSAAGDGFQTVALSLSQRGGGNRAAAAAGRGLLDPVPIEIAVARRADKAARPRPQELAAAPPPRRR